MGARGSILMGAALALALIWIFPSWLYVSEIAPFEFQSKIGSYWIWSPPMPYGVRLHWEKNLAYSLLVALAAQGLLSWNRWISR